MESRQSLDFLDIQYRALLQLGLDIGALTGRGFIKYPLTFLFLAIVMCYLQYGVMLFAVHIFKVKIGQATSALSMFNECSLIWLKVMVLIFKSNRLLKLIWDMNLLATSASPREHNVWISENRRAVMISKIYAGLCWAPFICAVAIPIVLMGYQYVQGEDVELKLPFEGEFLIKNDGIPNYILNYILSLIHGHTLLKLNISIDTLYGWLVYTVSAHFRILRIKVEEAANEIKDHDNHNDFLKDLGSIVRYHNKILRIVNEVNRTFGVIFFAEVTFSIFQLCFLMYSLSNDSEIQYIPFNVLLFMAISMQVMIYCFGGQKIITESDMLCEDIYMKFPWEKMLPSEKKLMWLPLMRSQKKTRLLGILFELDHNLLVYMYRTAFSFYTLLGAIKN